MIVGKNGDHRQWEISGVEKVKEIIRDNHRMVVVCESKVIEVKGKDEKVIVHGIDIQEGKYIMETDTLIYRDSN